MGTCRARVTALAVFTVAAVTHGCVDDAGCELLGKCVAGRCNCLPGFVGSTCGRLDLLPAPAKTRGQVWPQAPMPESLRHTMAWSFAPFRDPATGGYHAVVEVGCGPTWEDGFHLALLSSVRPDGGYEFARWLSPALVNSPHVTALANGTVVLHFQTGRVQWPPNASAPTCSGSTAVNPPVPAGGVALRACGKGETEARDECLCSTLTPGAECTANIHVASAASVLTGRWDVAPVTVTGAGWNPFNATVPNIGESNPAVGLLRDGSVVLAFRSHLKGGYWPGVGGEHIGFALGGSLLQREFTVAANLSWGHPASGNDEDPFCWQQREDLSLHCLYHNGRSSTTNLGLHAFSADGKQWHKPAQNYDSACAEHRNCSAMYTNLVELDDGTSTTLVGRERPSLLFDPATGRPTHLYNGAIPADVHTHGTPWYSMVQAVGA